MIKTGDLFFQSTKTKRAANMDKLTNLEGILKKDYTEAELSLNRHKFEHSVMQGLNQTN